MSTAEIRITFTGPWLGGTGAGRGRDVDAIAYRDRWDCPAMPMSQVKGQVRETACRLVPGGHGGWTAALVADLFGTPDREAALSFVGEARLEPEAHAWFRMSEADSVDGARRALFLRFAATRINPAGVAEDKTLRAIEAVVPLTLIGRVVAHRPPAGIDWVALLDAACAATLAFGKLKADGYGRAVAEAKAVGA